MAEHDWQPHLVQGEGLALRCTACKHVWWPNQFRPTECPAARARQAGREAAAAALAAALKNVPQMRADRDATTPHPGPNQPTEECVS